MRKHLLTTSSKSSESKWTSVPYLALFFIWSLCSLAFSSANAQCTLACTGTYSVSLNQSGEALINPASLLIDPDCDPNDFTVNIYWNSQNIGNLLNCSHIGYVLEAKVVNNVSGNFCWSNVEVMDYAYPQISCTDTVITCNLNPTPEVAGYPTATDNCSVFSNNDFTYSDTYVNLPCTSIQDGINITARIERKWWVSDAGGLTDTCVQNIYLRRASLDDVVFPENRDGLQQPFLDCSQSPLDLSLTGKPTIFGAEVVNDDACELTVSYSDLTLNSCGNNTYNIIRTWTAADWCTGVIITHGQIIKVKDTTAPEIFCPSDFTVSASVISCGATVLLPTATATDDCSDFEISVSWQYGSGTGPFYNVPVGTHQVTYSAEDDCGNISNCQIQVTVVDDIAPVNICKTALSINISTGGSATVPAITFDDGSFDNCQIDNYQAKRSGMPFGAFVTFDCADVSNGPISVTFRIFDTSGNYNDCIATVTVHDNIPALISCPSEVTLECTDDVSNITLTGEPTVFDNCGIDTLFYTDEENINNCGIGNVTRTWIVIDVAGHSTSCTQNIIIEDNTPVDVSFPANFSSSECGIIETNPTAAGEPIITGDDCESIDYTYTDDVFNTAAPACYTILRNWVVIDWCTYVPNSGSTDGYYTHTQVITITDDVAPVLSVPTSQTAFSQATDCGSDFIIVESATAIDCNPNVVITNDSPYAISGGANASGSYPIGVYNITFTANDDCGNVTTETMELTVEDGLGPTAICLSGLSVSLNSNSIFTLEPEMINYGSYDNCTAPENLLLTVSPSVFDCTSVGDQSVTLTVKDESGNISTCTTIVEVQDNQNFCGQNYELSGLVLTPQGVPMSDAEVQIIGAEETTLVYTDENGIYSFNGAEEGETFEVQPYNNKNSTNGVSSWDLVLMGKHILEISPITDPYKLIAADVNHSGGISTFDMVLLKKLILNVDTTFKNNTSWRFIDANFVFPNTSNPFSSYFPESIFIESLTSDQASLDFMAVKIGDVNGNANPNSFLEIEERDAKSALVFEFENKEFKEDELVEIVFKAKTSCDLMAYQFTIELDTNLLEYVEIVSSDDLKQSKVGKDDFGFSQLKKGLITTQWANFHEERLGDETEFFRLRCTAKSVGLLREALRIHSNVTEAIAYANNQIDEVEELKVLHYFQDEISIVSENSDVVDEIEASISNYPNPFKSYTNIMITSSEEGSAKMELIDRNGRLLKSVMVDLKLGENSIYLDRSDCPFTGVYFCQVLLPDSELILSKKLMVVD
ncbi:MAG: HYR domain-containing protein [Saprospiraceae bacterium]